MKSTNPNGANGTTSDPREQICWDFYVEGIANGRVNAYDSAIKAGYSEDHARNITLQGWFKERLEDLRRKEMFSKAERNLAKVLDFEMITEEGKVNTPVATLVVGVSTTIAKTLGKDKGYSERIEQTGKDGKDLPQPIMQIQNVHTNNGDKENSSDAEEGKSGTGGNISKQDNINTSILDSIGTNR